MGIFDSCLLACDIDGTLVENGYMNPKNAEMIEFFMSEGGYFSLSTGRSIGAIGDVLSKVKRVSPCVVANGCMIYDYEKRETIYEKTIPDDSRRIALAVQKSKLNVGIEIHCRETVFTLKRNDRTTLHQTYEKFTSTDVDYETACKHSWNKVLYVPQNVDDMPKLKEFIAAENTDSLFINTCASINAEMQHYYEQMPLGVSKASALKELCKILGIKEGGLFAIGDYYNDAEMLKMADIAAVPHDSPEKVKKYAQYITVSCNDGAVADFIEYLKKCV